jgi:hypothetical protein
MKAVVVYESFWGNTAGIARAVAEGLGPGVPALTTDEAVGDAIAGADLFVVGAPVLAFGLPAESVRKGLPDEKGAPSPADISHPSMRSWLDGLPKGAGRAVAFETRISWSPRGATSTIMKKLGRAGYTRLADDERFLVTGRFGPLKDGEIERARAWGARLASEM